MQHNMIKKLIQTINIFFVHLFCSTFYTAQFYQLWSPVMIGYEISQVGCNQHLKTTIGNSVFQLYSKGNDIFVLFELYVRIVDPLVKCISFLFLFLIVGQGKIKLEAIDKNEETYF